jgi:2-(3-amino-3-carboxypropyl)histidine synthase
MTLKETISQATDAVEGIERPINSAPTKPTKPRKRFVGTSTPKASSSKTVRRVANQIPDDILHDAELNAAIDGKSCIRSIMRNADITALPGNYNFEIHKTIYQVRRDGVKTVALQMPEGLMMYGCAIADIVERSVLTPCLLDSRLILVDSQGHCRYYLPM